MRSARRSRRWLNYAGGRTAAPARPTGSPTLFHSPACTSGAMAATFTHRTHNAGEMATVLHARPLRKPNCSAEALPEIDTRRTLIARSGIGSVGSGERIGQRGRRAGASADPAARTQQNNCSGRCGRSCRLTGLARNWAVLRAAVLGLADHVLLPEADAEAHAVPCRTPGPRGWRPAQGHRRPRPRGATTLSGKQMTPPRPRVPGGKCSTAPVIAGARGAICGQIMALDVHSSRPERRSDDGQTILKAASAGWKLGSDLGKLVELRGFEPRTSCMPSAGSASTAVRLCRSPSQSVRISPVRSAPVAVLRCCTALRTRQ